MIPRAERFNWLMHSTMSPPVSGFDPLPATYNTAGSAPRAYRHCRQYPTSRDSKIGFVECRAPPARVLEWIHLIRRLDPRLVFHSLHWELRCEYRCDQEGDPRFVFGISLLSQVHKCKVFVSRRNILKDRDTHNRTYFLCSIKGNNVCLKVFFVTAK